jgi:hypothetical protein
MAHFAELDENNIVQRVIVISNDVTYENNEEIEQRGIDFCKSLYGEDTIWVQTSYNNNFRKQYALIGSTYDETNDVFIEESPYESWTLDSNFDWTPPIEYPQDSKDYYWDEDNQQWVEAPETEIP